VRHVDRPGCISTKPMIDEECLGAVAHPSPAKRTQARSTARVGNRRPHAFVGALLDFGADTPQGYFLRRVFLRAFFADLSTRKSSRLAPALIAAVNQRG
jgi:hypothetical protein